MLAVLNNIKKYLLQYLLLDIFLTILTFIAWYFFKDNLNIFIILIILNILIDIYIGFTSGRENDLYEVGTLFIIIILYQIITYNLIKLIYPSFSVIRLLFSWYSMIRLSAFPYLIASFLGWKNY